MNGIIVCKSYETEEEKVRTVTGRFIQYFHGSLRAFQNMHPGQTVMELVEYYSQKYLLETESKPHVVYP